jgi:hypothetical protein
VIGAGEEAREVMVMCLTVLPVIREARLELEAIQVRHRESLDQIFAAQAARDIASSEAREEVAEACQALLAMIPGSQKEADVDTEETKVPVDDAVEEALLADEPASTAPLVLKEPVMVEHVVKAKPVVEARALHGALQIALSALGRSIYCGLESEFARRQFMTNVQDCYDLCERETGKRSLDMLILQIGAALRQTESSEDE